MRTKNRSSVRRTTIAQRIAASLVFSSALMIGHISASFAADVLLMVDGVRGQGTLQKRGNECLIITPKHVVNQALSDIVVIFPDRSEVVASVLEIYTEDIALLRLNTQPVSGCADQAFIDQQLPMLLKSVTEGVLKRRDESGSASLLQVDVVGYDEHRLIRIEPRSSSKSIKQGFSGSVLYLDNQAVGMLIKNDRQDTETGLVLRAETLNATVGPFFNAASGQRTFFVQLDSASDFLMGDVQSLAREQKLAISAESDGATYRLNVKSDIRELDTETDKIVEYQTRLMIVDTLDRTIADQVITASGNSFIDLASAQRNAKVQLTEQLRQSGFPGKLP